MNIQGWFPLGLTGLISLLPKGLSRVFSSITVWKHQFCSAQPLYGPYLTPIHGFWKNHSFDCMDFCWQSDVFAFKTLSRLVIVFLPRSKCILISWLQKICHCFHFFPFNLPWTYGRGCMILVFWMLSFKLAFSFFSFTLIKRLFSYSSLSAIRVASSAYLRLLIFLLEILIPACYSSSPAFHMIGEHINPSLISLLVQDLVLIKIKGERIIE